MKSRKIKRKPAAKRSEVVWVNSKFTGGHYCLKNNRSASAFTNPMKSCSKVKLYKDDIVVDIGAYVGEYSIHAANCGVSLVRSYEATPATFRILSKNKRNNMQIFNQAVVGNDSKTVKLYLSSGIGVTNSIAKSKGKKSVIEIDAIKYEDAVKDATVVKIDVEGAEYSYDIIQKHLRAIILEFHPIEGVDWIKNARRIMNQIKTAGFKPMMVPKFQNGWDTNSSWVKG